MNIFRIIIKFILIKIFKQLFISNNILKKSENVCSSFLTSIKTKECFANLEEETNFEIFIPLVINNYQKFKYLIKYISKINNNNIYIATNKKLKYNITKLCKNCKFLDEDLLYEKLSLKKVQKIISLRNGNPSRAGWYLQQFLKMSFSFLSKYNYYLAFDADTIPNENIKFFNQYSKPYFDIKTEYHIPYFNTLKNLVSLGKEFNFSFISEHMVINKFIMQEFIDLIEKNKSLKGENFFEKILFVIEKTSLSLSGFSEYESYGTYASKMYPSLYNFRKLKTLRNGNLFLGEKFDNEIIDWAFKSYDLISFEHRHKTNEKIFNLIKNEEFRKFVSLNLIAKQYNKIYNITK